MTGCLASFWGALQVSGHIHPHLVQETYSASFLKPMARRLVGVPLVPFQRWVFQGSGWEERTAVTMVTAVTVVGEPGSPGRRSGSWGLWLPSHAQPTALQGVILRVMTTGVPAQSSWPSRSALSC